MININNTLSKIEEKKLEKKKKLTQAAYKLFTDKGVGNTSISDISNEAGVAKGTFYLYFKDKKDIEEKVIVEKSLELFNRAFSSIEKEYTLSFPDKLIAVIDYIIDYLTKNMRLIKFINKDLSLGIFNGNIVKLIDNEYIDVKNKFINGLNEYSKTIDNPEVTLFMIIELVSSTIYSTIIKKEPLPIEEFKPYLYNEIRKMVN